MCMCVKPIFDNLFYPGNFFTWAFSGLVAISSVRNISCVSQCVCVCVSHILRNKKCQERALYTLQLLVWPILVLVVEPVFASVRHSQTFNPLRTI